MIELDKVMGYLDTWVVKYGDYVPEDYIPPIDGVSKLHHLKEASIQGIQQVRSEIKEFVEIILNKGLSNNALEIGIGLYGGTHMLWRQLFGCVVSIEMYRILVMRFKLYEHIDNRSKIIVGNSHELKTYNKVKGGYDLVFIDGDHNYNGVKQDWIMYSGLVNKGGIIAFHDSNCSIGGFGVKQFLKELELGKIDGKLHNIQYIHHSKNIGIGYELV